MKDIEDRLKEEYDKVEVPDYMFDTSRVFKRAEKENNDSKKKVVSIAASIVAILLIAVLLIIAMPNLLKEDDVEIEEKSDNLKERAIGKITINKENSIGETKNVDCVLAINVNETLYQIIDGIPYTIIKAKVLNSFFGDLSEEVEMYVPGGFFTVKEIKENIQYEQIDVLNKYQDNDIIETYYYYDIYIPVAEEGKTYITTLKEIDGKYFVNMNAKYGFKEYDPETNIVKDDMGDEQLDIDRYLESINI